VGTSTITATLGAVSGSTLLTVTAATLVSIAVAPANPTVVINATKQFIATGTYTDATTQVLTLAVTWSSSNAGSATISNAPGSNGLASTTALVGTSTISATSGIVAGSTLLTVSSVPAGCRATAVAGTFICLSNSKVSAYATSSICGACTEKGLVNACVDKTSCITPFTNAIVQSLYTERTGNTCTTPVGQSISCGWYEMVTDYPTLGICPTPYDCTTSINWQNCMYGTPAPNANSYAFGVCKAGP
jgi:hypothetical protein